MHQFLRELHPVLAFVTSFPWSSPAFAPQPRYSSILSHTRAVATHWPLSPCPSQGQSTGTPLGTATGFAPAPARGEKVESTRVVLECWGQVTAIVITWTTAPAFQPAQ